MWPRNGCYFTRPLCLLFVPHTCCVSFPCRSWRRAARTRTKLWTSATTRTSTGARRRRSPRTKKATSRVCTASITVRKRWTCPRPFDWPRGCTPWTASKSLTSLDILAKSTCTLCEPGAWWPWWISNETDQSNLTRIVARLTFLYWNCGHLSFEPFWTEG